MNKRTTTLSIVFAVSLTCIATETKADALVCAADYATIVDPVITITPKDCVTARIVGENWGGCSGNPQLHVTNGCEAPLAGASQGLLCMDSSSSGFQACEELAPNQSGQLALDPPVEGEVLTAEITLRDEDGSETLVQVEYGALDIGPRPEERSDEGCSTTASGGSTGAALLLAAFGLAAGRRRRR